MRLRGHHPRSTLTGVVRFVWIRLSLQVRDRNGAGELVSGPLFNVPEENKDQRCKVSPFAVFSNSCSLL
jgi:hypothetical protein